MIEQTMPSATSQLDRSSPLRLPLQAAPIDRSQFAASAVMSGGGVEADISFDEILGGIGKVASTVGTVGSALAPILGLFSDRALKRDITLVDWSR